MGMFDTIHTPSGCGQVKCFGRSLADLEIGSKVQLHSPLEEASHEALLVALRSENEALGLDGVELMLAMARDPRSDVLFAGEPQAEKSYEVLMYDGGGFLHVRRGRITGWDGEFDPRLPCFDGYGNVVAVIGAVGSTRKMDRELCDECS
jgi:hypothetical protein